MTLNHIIAEYAAALSGTFWIESGSNGTYFLTCNDENAQAVDEIMLGKSINVTDSQGGYFDSNITGGLASDAEHEPALKWLFDRTNNTFYKVIAVLNENLIQVEALHGTNPYELIGCGTRGYGLRKIIVSATATTTIYQYSANTPAVELVIATGTTFVYQMNEEKGPVFIEGTGGVSGIALRLIDPTDIENTWCIFLASVPVTSGNLTMPGIGQLALNGDPINEAAALRALMPGGRAGVGFNSSIGYTIWVGVNQMPDDWTWLNFADSSSGPMEFVQGSCNSPAVPIVTKCYHFPAPADYSLSGGLTQWYPIYLIEQFVGIPIEINYNVDVSNGYLTANLEANVRVLVRAFLGLQADIIITIVGDTVSVTYKNSYFTLYQHFDFFIGDGSFNITNLSLTPC